MSILNQLLLVKRSTEIKLICITFLLIYIWWPAVRRVMLRYFEWMTKFKVDSSLGSVILILCCTAITILAR